MAAVSVAIFEFSRVMGNTDHLYSAALFYKESLANRRYEIIIGRKNEQRIIELLFLPCHFYHLAGLHKLNDLPYMKRKADIIYREILNRKITHTDIQKSVHYNELADRIIYYGEIINILSSDSLYFKSLHGSFKGVSADCVLTKTVEAGNKYSFLFLRYDRNVYMPCSFFMRNEQKEYTKEGTLWKILSIKEIDRFTPRTPA